MLGKLLKHEFKQTAKAYAPSYLALTAVIVFTVIVSYFTTISSSELNIGNLPDIILAMLMIATFIGIFAIIFGTVILEIARFSKNLMDVEGYFMFSLPVSAASHIAAKLIVATAWAIISIAFSLIAVPILIMGISRIPAYELSVAIKTLLPLITPEIVLAVISVIFATIMGIVFCYSLAYMAISVGPHVTKNRIVGSLIVFFGSEMALNVASTALMGFAGSFALKNVNFNSLIASLNANPAAAITITMLFTLVHSLAVSALCLTVCNYFLSKKLNLS
ncbi:MAG: hypothetical protein RR198_04670 [Oscillospiraceae bacterium]